MNSETLQNRDGIVKTREEWNDTKQKQEGENGVITSEVVEEVIKKPKKRATKKTTKK